MISRWPPYLYDPEPQTPRLRPCEPFCGHDGAQPAPVYPPGENGPQNATQPCSDDCCAYTGGQP